jgi:hypothetical protein
LSFLGHDIFWGMRHKVVVTQLPLQTINVALERGAFFGAPSLKPIKVDSINLEADVAEQYIRVPTINGQALNRLNRHTA